MRLVALASWLRNFNLLGPSLNGGLSIHLTNGKNMSEQYAINDKCFYCGGSGKRILCSDVDANGDVVDIIIDCSNCSGDGYVNKGVLETEVSLAEILSVCKETLRRVKKIQKKIDAEGEEV